MSPFLLPVRASAAAAAGIARPTADIFIEQFYQCVPFLPVLVLADLVSISSTEGDWCTTTQPHRHTPVR